MEMEETHYRIIIGAGPAGLSLAYELQQIGLNCLLLEKGAQVANSWQTMPPFLKMVSTGAANTLGRDNRELSQNSFYRMPAHDYAHYLQNFSHSHDMHVDTNVHVQEVRKINQDIFEIITSTKIYRARQVINATGYISLLNIPAIFQNNNATIPIVHFQNFATITKIPEHARVLIVGKRLSAGQLLDELSERQDLTLELSTRSAIGYSMGHPWDKLIFANLLKLESILFHTGLNPKLIDVKMMDGVGVRRLRAGQIKVRGQVQEIQGNRVSFDNGEHEEYAMILLATGYQPALRHLPLEKHRDVLDQLGENKFEVKNCPGLYVLGLESQLNFRSRFIRGMREDARILAQIISKKNKS
jgi:putative flavoprotein involved in K+ transport